MEKDISQTNFSIKLALPLGDFGVGEVELVFSVRTRNRFFIESGANGVKLELHLVQL